MVKRRTGSISTAEIAYCDPDDVRRRGNLLPSDANLFSDRLMARHRGELRDYPSIVHAKQSAAGTSRSSADWTSTWVLSERSTPWRHPPAWFAGWVYVHHYVQATRRGERAPFTCIHPKLTVQEKWEETALRRLFFDPPLLLAPPKLHQTPVTYLRTRARRAVKDGFRALSLMHMWLFGFPGAETLLNQVDKDSAPD